MLFLFIKELNGQNFEPNKSIFDIYDYQFEYYSKIRTKLYTNLSDNPQVRLIVKPSFSPEYIFQIEKSDSGYLAKVNIMSESIWYNENYNSIEVNEFVSIISEEDVKLLSKVYLKSIGKVHYPIKESFGLDGVTYNLSAWDYGLKSGEIWSPNDSLNQTIINITSKLIQDIKNKRRKVLLSEKSRIELEQIFNKLNTLPNLDGYKLILNTKEIIEINKQKYISRLSENHKDYLTSSLHNFEQKMIFEFSFNIIDKIFIEKLIDEYIKRFNNYIEFETYFEDSNDIEKYKLQNVSDNIFIKLKSDLK